MSIQFTTFKKFLVLSFIFLFFSASAYADLRNIDSRDLSVMISVEVDRNAPSITLNWTPMELASVFQISRKMIDDENWGNPIAELTNGETSYTDNNVALGAGYEYRVAAISEGNMKLRFQRQDGTAFDSIVTRSFIGFGYSYAGLELPETDSYGKVLLVIDETINTALSTEIDELAEQLISEGWSILRRTVPRTETFDPEAVKNVKAIIEEEYNNDPENLTTVFLLGRVAVPYSGIIYPDGHPNHVGAWPADLYYGHFGSWTDVSANNTSASREANQNIPGDGKFDQSTIAKMSMTLQVGRVDLYNMPLFEDSEVELLRKYIQKNLKYRTGQMEYEYKGLVDDNFNATGMQEAFASSGWRNIAAITGGENIVGNNHDQGTDWLKTLGDDANGTFLWAYGTGGGSYTSCSGVAKTDQLAAQNINAIFTMMFGSYFGDWDVKNNILRAGLCTQPSVLTCAWAGRPHWFLHHMDMGYPIGYSTKLSQHYYQLYYPNLYYYNENNPNQATLANNGSNQIHSALMGDPTLCMHMGQIGIPNNLQVTQDGNNDIVLAWDAPEDDNIVGYNIYRSKTKNGPYRKMNEEAIAGTSYNDSQLYEGALYYLVRTLKLRTVNSGAFFNMSAGAMAEIEAVNPNPPAPVLLVSPSNGAEGQPAELELHWETASEGAAYTLNVSKDQSFGDSLFIDETGLTETSYNLTELEGGATYYWRVSATNKNGQGDWSEVWNFKVVEPIGPPNVIIPGDGALSINPEIPFSWLSKSGAEAYRLQISENQDFSGEFTADTVVITTKCEFPKGTLKLETQYYWRIQSIAGGIGGSWSETMSFTTMDDPSEVKEMYDRNNKLQLSNFPEPVKEFSYINFYLPNYGHVTLELFEVSGRKVSTLINENMLGGRQQIKFERNGLPPGLYFYSITTNGLTQTRKMIIIE